jgi:Ca2+-binding RTX toxin-like protein
MENDGDILDHGTDDDDVIKATKAVDNDEDGIVDPHFTSGLMGDDLIFGTTQSDYIFGDEGDDVLAGGAALDLLDGGEGEDVLKGGSGDDHLVGGAGEDWLKGGKGADTFVVTTDNLGQPDFIRDFSPGEDKLEIVWVSEDRDLSDEFLEDDEDWDDETYVSGNEDFPDDMFVRPTYDPATGHVDYRGDTVAILKKGLDITDADLILI